MSASTKRRTATPSVHKEAFRHKAKKAGYKVHIVGCRNTGRCPISGSWHVTLAGNGRYRNQLSLADADRLLAEWIAADSRPAAATAILAVWPWRAGTVVHLHQPGYQPGKKRRSVQDGGALCNVSVHGCELVPLDEALALVPGGSPIGVPLRWCHVCVGHAAAIHGLLGQVLAQIVGADGRAAAGAES